MYKKLYNTGLVVYAVLLALAVVFYKERIILNDTSFFLFHIVKDNTFCIQVFRFGDIFSQMPAVAGRWLRLPLQTIAVLYSAGFILYHLACYIVCGSVLRQPRLALVILLGNVLLCTHTFYWTISQVPQCISLLMVLLALFKHGKPGEVSTLKAAGMVALLSLLLLFHPLAVFPLAYALLYFSQWNEGFVSRRTVYLTIAISALIMGVKVILFKTPYERHSMSGLKNFIVLFPDYFNTYANRNFLKKCMTSFGWLPVLYVAVSVYHLVHKRWRALALMTVFFTGYLVLINTSYYSAATPESYIESLYAPLAFFVVLPVATELLPAMQKWALPLVILVCLTGVVRMERAHTFYTNRLDYERKLIAANGDKKVIVHANKADMDTLQMLWGTPYEVWLLSTIETGRTASIIVDEHPRERGWAAHKTHDLVVNYNIYPYRELPAKYFVLTDTVNGYEVDE